MNKELYDKLSDLVFCEGLKIEDLITFTIDCTEEYQINFAKRFSIEEKKLNDAIENLKKSKSLIIECDETIMK